MKRCSRSLTIMEKKIKVIMRYHVMFIRMTTNKKSNQKGGVKEHVLISSCKITKIKTRCWTTINRRMLELTKKKKKKNTACPKIKLKPQETVGGAQSQLNKSHSCWVNDPQTEGQLYQRSFPTVVKVLNPTTGFPAWGFDKGTGNSQRILPWRQPDLITGFPQD